MVPGRPLSLPWTPNEADWGDGPGAGVASEEMRVLGDRIANRFVVHEDGQVSMYGRIARAASSTAISQPSWLIMLQGARERASDGFGVETYVPPGYDPLAGAPIRASSSCS